VIYGATAEEAAKIGFRDEFMYKFIQKGMKEESVLKIEHLPCSSCTSLFGEYEEKRHKLY
jgi:guanine deaminase